MGPHRHLISAEDPMTPFNGLETHLSITSRYHQLCCRLQSGLRKRLTRAKRLTNTDD